MGGRENAVDSRNRKASAAGNFHRKIYLRRTFRRQWRSFVLDTEQDSE